MKLLTRHNEGERGFIALTSTLMLTMVLTILMFSTSASSFFARFDALDSQYKRVSLGLSESCSNAALLKVAQNYHYDPTTDPTYVMGKGVPVNIGPDTCYIQSVDYSNIVIDPVSGNETKKTTTIRTSAQYPTFAGSWSSNKISATIQNPAVSTASPPPTCSFSATAGPIIQGQNVTMNWLTAGSATSFKVERNIGGTITTIYNGAPGGSPITDIPSDSATYTATITGPGGSTQCVSPRSVVVQPPPDCADTMMMTDLSGSLTTTDKTNIKNAENTLIDLYAGVAAQPKVGTGGFGGTAFIPLTPDSGQLSFNYVGLKNAVNTMVNAGASGGSNLSAGIDTGTIELTSIRHTAGFRKVMVFVSDGLANRPFNDSGNAFALDINAALDKADTAKLADVEMFTIHFGSASGQQLMAELASGNVPFPANDTGLLSPTSNGQNGVGDSWTNPGNVYAAGVATAVNNADKRHRYTFNLPAISAGAAISDVIVQMSAWFTDPLTSTASSSPASAIAPNNWSNPNNAFTSNNVYATETTNGDQQGYTNFGLNVPAGAIISGIVADVESKSTDNSGCSVGMELSSNNGVSFTSSGNTASLSTTENYRTIGGPTNLWGRAWSNTDFNNGNFVVRLKNIGGGSCTGGSTLSVDHLRVKVFYVPIPSTSCQVGVDLSWDGGANWSSEQLWTLPSTATTHSFNSAGGWGGHVWNSGDFSSANFRARVHAIDPDASCADAAVTNLDTLQTRVLYGSTHQSGSDNQFPVGASQAVQENGDNDHFFIAPTTADMPGIFDTIGKLACPAAVPPLPPAPPALPPPPPLPPPPVSIGSWDEVISVNP